MKNKFTLDELMNKFSQGGKTTSQKYGKEYMKELQKKSVAARKANKDKAKLPIDSE